MTDTNHKQLGNTLWSIADQLRGAMDAHSSAAVASLSCWIVTHGLEVHGTKFFYPKATTGAAEARSRCLGRCK